MCPVNAADPLMSALRLALLLQGAEYRGEALAAGGMK